MWWKSHERLWLQLPLMQLWENWSSRCCTQNVASSIRKLWNRQHLLEDSQLLWLMHPWKTAISRPHFDIGFWLFSKMTCCLNHKLEYESIEKFRGKILFTLIVSTGYIARCSTTPATEPMVLNYWLWSQYELNLPAIMCFLNGIESLGVSHSINESSFGTFFYRSSIL